ncbi:MAG: LptF/LptG family permease [Verrucomicrobia bacterium]|nr:LptF/LptG family permease [Verrucomicrobiota bacterium]
MRLLDRYLLRELLVPLGYCLSGFLVFWISFDLISELDDFQKARLRAGDVAEYYLVKTPEFLVTVMPIALLLALLYALTHHARHHELTAMRAAGVSFWRLSVPYLGVGLVFSLGVFALNEFCVPSGTDLADQILDRHLGGGDWRRNVGFHNSRDGRTWTASALNLRTGELRNPQVDWRLPDGTRRQVFADQARWTNGGWTFYGVQEFLYHSPQETVATEKVTTNVWRAAGFAETPAQIKSQLKVDDLSSISASKKTRLAIREIQEYFQWNPHPAPDKYTLLRTQWEGRLAEPWTCLVVVLIALPFGAAGGRRNVFVGVANSITICFAYYILLRLGLALGTGGYLPPWLAAWSPNLLFAGAGIWLTQRQP